VSYFWGSTKAETGVLVMRALAVGLWMVMGTTSVVVMTIAMGLWFRDVLRGRATDGVEPAPVTGRTALYSLLAALAFSGTRLASGERLTFSDAAFPALLIGMALSAGWYLLARRTPDGASASKTAVVSMVIAASFGALTGAVQP
jgi:hypothetical protein